MFFGDVFYEYTDDHIVRIPDSVRRCGQLHEEHLKLDSDIFGIQSDHVGHLDTDVVAGPGDYRSSRRCGSYRNTVLCYIKEDQPD